jgi:hypothetical protein
MHDGYGRFLLPGGQAVRAHRLAWEIMNGPIPEGAMIIHACDNPPCCNPAHLRCGTALDNALDREARGHGFKALGTKNGKGKLTDEQVAAIRVDARRGATIAREYGVSQALVSMIRKGDRRPA